MEASSIAKPRPIEGNNNGPLFLLPGRLSFHIESNESCMVTLLNSNQNIFSGLQNTRAVCVELASGPRPLNSSHFKVCLTRLPTQAPMAQPLPALQRRPETAQDNLVKAYLREHSSIFRACDELSEQVSPTVH